MVIAAPPPTRAAVRCTWPGRRPRCSRALRAPGCPGSCASSVVGMSETPNDSSVTWVTVSEMPETAIEPFSAMYRVSSGARPISTSSQRGPGVRLRIVPTPSTCPCTTCPPYRPPTASARSRLTGLATPRSSSALRRSVSGMTSAQNVPSPGSSVTVRQTPETLIESPRWASDDDERAAHAQPGVLRRLLDGLDGADLLDDSGEHQCSSWCTVVRVWRRSGRPGRGAAPNGWSGGRRRRWT